MSNVTFDSCAQTSQYAIGIRPNGTYGNVIDVTVTGSRVLNSARSMEAGGSMLTFTNNAFGAGQVYIYPATTFTASGNTGWNG